MSALVRQLGDVAPIGQMVFFRSAFAILPVVVIYAIRGELYSAVRTSRPLGQFGRGMSAERIAERIRALSGGKLDIAVYAAGEVVPAFEVLDAVGSGVADIGHTASFYWQGKMPAAAFFTTVPFGLTPGEHDLLT